MTEEELLNSFLNSPSSVAAGSQDVDGLEVDKEAALLSRFLDSGNEVPTPSPVVVPKVEEKNILGRSKDSLQLGLSDAISTVMGDTYGRGTDDQTALTPVNKAWRPVSAAADTLKGVGNVVGDIVSSADEAIGNPLSKTMAWMEKNKSESPIYSNAGLEQALEDLREFTPEYAPAIEEAALVASAALPTKLLPKTKFTPQRTKLEKSLEKQKAKDIERRWEPDNTIEAPGRVTQTAGRDVYDRTDFELTLAGDIAVVDGLNPRAGYKSNVNTLNDRVDEIRVDLDEKLRYSPDLDVDAVQSGFPEVFERIKDKATLTGSPESIGARIYDEFIKRLEDATGDAGTINPKDLLQIRRDLDGWVTGGNKSSKVFDSSTLTAQSVALKEIRDEINSIVINSTDSIDVAEALRKQSSLLTARDQIMPKAVREPKTALGRAVAKIETETGLGAPQTPLALASNLTNWPSIAIGVGGTGYSLGKRGIQNAARYGGAGLEKAVQQAYLGGRGPLTLAATQELMKKDEDLQVPYRR